MSGGMNDNDDASTLTSSSTDPADILLREGDQCQLTLSFECSGSPPATAPHQMYTIFDVQAQARASTPVSRQSSPAFDVITPGSLLNGNPMTEWQQSWDNSRGTATLLVGDEAITWRMCLSYRIRTNAFWVIECIGRSLGLDCELEETIGASQHTDGPVSP